MSPTMSAMMPMGSTVMSSPAQWQSRPLADEAKSRSWPFHEICLATSRLFFPAANAEAIAALGSFALCIKDLSKAPRFPLHVPVQGTKRQIAAALLCLFDDAIGEPYQALAPAQLF